MMDPAPAPAPPVASKGATIPLARVLIVVGVVLVLFLGGGYFWLWYGGSVAGGVPEGSAPTPSPRADPAAAPPAVASPDIAPPDTSNTGGTDAPFGRSTLADLEDWVFLYPGADYAGGNVVVDSDGLSAGAFVLLTDDPGADVFAHYEQQLRDAGYEVTSQTTGDGIGGRSSGVVMGRVERSGRTFSVIISVQGGRTHINTQFQDRNL